MNRAFAAAALFFAIQFPAFADITEEQRLQLLKARQTLDSVGGEVALTRLVGAPGAYRGNSQEVAYYIRRALAVLGNGRRLDVSEVQIEAARRYLDRGHVLRTAHDAKALNEAIHLVEDVVFFSGVVVPEDLGPVRIEYPGVNPVKGLP